MAKFHYYHERETIRKKAYELNSTLKESNLGIGIQRPKAVRDARKALYDVMQQEKAKGHNVRMRGDTLLINRRPYSPQTTTADARD